MALLYPLLLLPASSHHLNAYVSIVVGMVAEGMSSQEILEAYPDLESEDIGETQGFADEAVRERTLPLVVS